MIRFPPLRLELSDEERDDLLLKLVIQNRHLAEVNSLLICTVLQKLGLSQPEIDEELRAAHELVNIGLQQQLAEHTEMSDDLSNEVRTAFKKPPQEDAPGSEDA